MRSGRRILVLSILSLVLALAGPVQGAFAEERGPSTPEERTKAVELTRYLEEDPLGDQAVKAREWLLKFLIEVPDITVELCTSFLGPLDKLKKPLVGIVTTQMVFSSAAFIIENPDQASDKHAAFLAGLEGALKVYKALLEKDPSIKQKKLAGLVKKNREELSEYVREKMKDCR